MKTFNNSARLVFVRKSDGATYIINGVLSSEYVVNVGSIQKSAEDFNLSVDPRVGGDFQILEAFTMPEVLDASVVFATDLGNWIDYDKLRAQSPQNIERYKVLEGTQYVVIKTEEAAGNVYQITPLDPAQGFPSHSKFRVPILVHWLTIDPTTGLSVPTWKILAIKEATGNSPSATHFQSTFTGDSVPVFAFVYFNDGTLTFANQYFGGSYDHNPY